MLDSIKSYQYRVTHMRERKHALLRVYISLHPNLQQRVVPSLKAPSAQQRTTVLTQLFPPAEEVFVTVQSSSERSFQQEDCSLTKLKGSAVSPCID